MLYKGIEKHIHNYFWRVFHSNGWSYHLPEDYDTNKEQEDLYSMTILEDYKCTVTAHVVTDARSLSLNGEYGVMWLYVKYEYQDADGHGWEELEEMQAAIIDAEDNLVKIGIPFESSYTFHGKNRANKKRRNDALLKRLNLKEKAVKDRLSYDEALKDRKQKVKNKENG